MWNRDSAYLEYQEIRRRIEQRFSRGRGLIIHVTIYLVVLVIMIIYGLYEVVDYTANAWVINPDLAHLFALWSLLLAGQGYWMFQRSAASNRLDATIERELRERLAQRDTQLLPDSQHAIQLHALLRGDLRRRAILSYVLLAYLFLNASLGIIWAYLRPIPAQEPFPYVWFGALLLALIIILPAWNVRLII